MAYVEMLRLKRALTTYTIVIAAIAVLIAASLYAGHVNVNTGDLRNGHIHIPLTTLLVVAGFASLIFGTIVSGSLNRERETLALSWTRPVSRERMATGYMLADLGGVVAAFLLTLIVGSIPLVLIGVASRVVADAEAPAAVAMMFGVTVMWYGLVQAATSWYRGRAGLAVGLTWGVFTVLLIVGHQSGFGPLVQAVTSAVNYLNPLAYASSYSLVRDGQQISVSSYLPLAEPIRMLMTWCIGLAACAVAIFAWKRSEA